MNYQKLKEEGGCRLVTICGVGGYLGGLKRVIHDPEITYLGRAEKESHIANIVECLPMMRRCLRVLQ